MAHPCGWSGREPPRDTLYVRIGAFGKKQNSVAVVAFIHPYGAPLDKKSVCQKKKGFERVKVAWHHLTRRRADGWCGAAAPGRRRTGFLTYTLKNESIASTNGVLDTAGTGVLVYKTSVYRVGAVALFNLTLRTAHRTERQQDSIRFY